MIKDWSYDRPPLSPSTEPVLNLLQEWGLRRAMVVKTLQKTKNLY